MDKVARLGIHRWRIGAALWLLAMAVLLWRVIVPLGRNRLADFHELRTELAFVERAGTLPHEIETVRREAELLDSLLASFENRRTFDEAQVVEEVYTLADSAGCAVSKVEIGAAITADDVVEIPISLNGSGSYESMGRFVDGVENSAYATRVRQVLLDKAGEDEGTLYLDFVVMEGR